MALQDQIKKDMMAAMKAKDTVKTAALRVVMGEFGRMDSKVLSDEDVVRILKKLAKSEKEVLERQGQAEKSRFIEILENYMPRMASEEDIAGWIEAHVDFAAYKNKMQAMGEIMRHFGSAADGNLVKRVLQTRF
jgi:uncharacterized protein YqeY